MGFEPTVRKRTTVFEGGCGRTSVSHMAPYSYNFRGYLAKTRVRDTWLYRVVTLGLLSNRLADGHLHGQGGADQLAPISRLFCGSASGTVRAMSALPSPADPDPEIGGGLVEMERELIRLLFEYDELRTAWPKGGHVLARAKIARQVADALARIDALEHVLATTPARTPAEEAVRRRRLAALSEAGLIPCDPFWPRPWRR